MKLIRKILSRLDETFDKLFEIALSDAQDRMRAMEMLLKLSGLMDFEESNKFEERPTYQQINKYFLENDV